MRLSCLATPERRGRREEEIASNRCRTCTDYVSSLGHILQVCAATHGLRTKRHNDVMYMLARKLRSIGFVTKMKFRLHLNNFFVKPDIFAWMAEDPDG